MARIGVWLVGARGSVAVTTGVGAAAVRAGLVPATGCVTQSAGFPRHGLAPLAGLVFGGHDVVDVPLAKRAEELVRDAVLPAAVVAAVGGDLAAAETRLRHGVTADQ